MYLNLQSSKFDSPDRMFHSMADAWRSCQRDSHDVKELIPELFFLPELFRNDNEYELGIRDNGDVMGDVKMPPWANSPEHFISVHRQVLQSW